MQCSYCKNEIPGNSSVEENGLVFCNPLHRYYYRQAHDHAAAASIPMPQESALKGNQPATIAAKKSASVVYNRIGSAVGVIIGIASSSYFGFTILIPVTFTLILLWILRKKSSLSEANLWAAALIGGHFVWMMLGAVFVGAVNQLYGDLIVMLVGLVWLLLRYNIGPVIFLLAYQILSVIINFREISDLEPNTQNFKALIVHIFLRLASSAFLVTGYMHYRKQPKPAVPQTSPVNPA